MLKLDVEEQKHFYCLCNGPKSMLNLDGLFRHTNYAWFHWRKKNLSIKIFWISTHISSAPVNGSKVWISSVKTQIGWWKTNVVNFAEYGSPEITHFDIFEIFPTYDHQFGRVDQYLWFVPKSTSKSAQKMIKSNLKIKN